MLKAIESGYIQKEIQESSYRYQKQIELKERIIVGLNEYIKDKERLNFNIYYPPKTLEKAQVERLSRLKKKRSAAAVRSRLEELKNAVQSGRNLMPRLIEAVKARVTLGEMTSILKGAFGEYRENISI
jgi:methylmalonyl-CoA mutase N-terminal domain/subunit